MQAFEGHVMVCGGQHVPRHVLRLVCEFLRVCFGCHFDVGGGTSLSVSNPQSGDFQGLEFLGGTLSN